MRIRSITGATPILQRLVFFVLEPLSGPKKNLDWTIIGLHRTCHVSEIRRAGLVHLSSKVRRCRCTHVSYVVETVNLSYQSDVCDEPTDNLLTPSSNPMTFITQSHNAFMDCLMGGPFAPTTIQVRTSLYTEMINSFLYKSNH